MVVNEVITLQFGNFANFLSAHYFNIQEAGFSFNPNFIPDILPDQLFRSSQDVSTGTVVNYTPRTVIVDSVSICESPFLEEIKDLPQESVDAEHEASSSNSPEKSSLKDMENELSNICKGYGEPSFKSSSKNVNNWPELMKTPLHQRSYIYSPKEHGLFSPEGLYHHGSQCSKEASFWDNIEDSIRFFAEECDSLEGFQIISEGHTAFSGVATTAVSHLKDEYPKKISILIPTYFLPENASNHELKLFSCNSLAFLADSRELVDNIIPLSTLSNPWSINEKPAYNRFKNVTYKEFDKNENSAVLAAALEYITLPYRKRDETNTSMTDFSEINASGRTISIAGTFMPLPCVEGGSLLTVLCNWEGSTGFFECLSPFGSFDKKFSADMCYTFLKGIFNQKSSCEDLRDRYSDDTMKVLKYLVLAVNLLYPTKIIKNYSSSMNFRVPLNFPAVFNNLYNVNHTCAEIGRISEFQGIGCLFNSKSVGHHLGLLQTRVKKDSVKLSLSPEEKSEIDLTSALESIATLEANYRDYHEL